MKGRLWDRVPIQFVDPPCKGQEFRFSFEKHGKAERTDPVVAVKQLTKYRYVFSSLDVDYTLEVTHV